MQEIPNPGKTQPSEDKTKAETISYELFFALHHKATRLFKETTEATEKYRRNIIQHIVNNVLQAIVPSNMQSFYDEKKLDSKMVKNIKTSFELATKIINLVKNHSEFIAYLVAKDIPVQNYPTDEFLEKNPEAKIIADIIHKSTPEENKIQNQRLLYAIEKMAIEYDAGKK